MHTFCYTVDRLLCETMSGGRLLSSVWVSNEGMCALHLLLGVNGGVGVLYTPVMRVNGGVGVLYTPVMGVNGGVDVLYTPVIGVNGGVFIPPAYHDRSQYLFPSVY